VLVFSTDAEFHDPATTSGYPGAGATETISVLQSSGTVVIGLGSQLGGVGLNQMNELVTASNGQFFALDSSSTGLGSAILNGLSTTLDEATLRLVSRGDAEGFAQVDLVAPVPGVGSDQSVDFTLPLTGAVQNGFFTQEYRFVIEVRAYESATLKVFPFTVTVPGVVPF
jgi:Zn-dependent alcohol dehydrogenase